MSEAKADIYLDAAATTPPSADVIERIRVVQADTWANPSSLHGPGIRAADCLERSRQSIASALGAERDQLTFTSGATESVHLALLGTALKRDPARLVISAVEHPAVVAAARRLERQGWQLLQWPVDGDGLIRLELLETMLAPPTQLVSMIWGQSEVGGLHPVLKVAQACRQRGITFHTDATQVIPQGLIRWHDHPIDLLSLSAHKLRGPRGVGLLLHRSDSVPDPLLGGGGQEGGIRSGTEPVALIAGMAEAMRGLPRFDPAVHPVPPGDPSVRIQRDRLLERLLRMDGVHLLGPALQARLPHHISLLIGDRQGRPLSARAVVRAMARDGLACSSGSACHAGRTEDSPVLAAMGTDPAWRRSGLRLTLGTWLSDADLATVPDRLDAARQSCT
ncbi:MAG: aminotransferase class V-fold PLP-dependent enzyme [Synechococcus sp. BS301-5m-G54]|nr:aminotransferase class V-fold PLP-dependent enzyme [Synechococcus sp. BS301-5m-G54]MBL6795433.1 aminotransferase class V-fold PLP-dependent enzyme [Synechococcus sp. BS307-5m-G34]